MTQEFQKDLYNHRWYNWIYYCEKVQDMHSDTFFKPIQQNDTANDNMDFLDTDFCQLIDDEENDNDNDNNNCNEESNQGNNTDIEVSQPDEDPDSPPPDKQIAYSSLLSACSELCRTIQNDKTELNKMYLSITEAIKVYRNGGRVFFNIETNGEEQNNNTLRAVTATVPNASNMKRKKSVREY